MPTKKEILAENDFLREKLVEMRNTLNELLDDPDDFYDPDSDDEDFENPDDSDDFDDSDDD